MRFHYPAGALALLLAGCATSTIEPPAELKEYEPRIGVKEVWDRGVVSGDGEFVTGLRVATDGVRAYVASMDGDLVAVRVKNGRTAWEREVDDAKWSGGPTVSGGLLAVGGLDGRVALYEADNGEQRWTADVAGEILAPPAVGGNTVVVRTTDGRVVALDAGDGRELWTVRREVPILTLRGASAPVISGESVYVGFDDGRLVVYNLANGVVRWETEVAVPTGRNELERTADVDGQIRVVEQDVYASAYNGKLVAVDAGSGSPLWSRDIPSHNGVETDFRRVFVSDVNSVVHAVARRNGGAEWKQEALRARRLTVPTPFGRTVAVGDLEGYLHFLDRVDGSQLARVKVDAGEPIRARPVVAGDRILVLSSDGELAAYSISDKRGETGETDD